MPKTVRIPYSLLMDLIRFFFAFDDSRETRKRIEDGLEKKIHSLYERELYSKSKTADSEEEREKARIKYLDEKGIPESFRW